MPETTPKDTSTEANVRLHWRGRCIGVETTDGCLYTHNFTFLPERWNPDDWPVVEPSGPPANVLRYLAAARRRAERRAPPHTNLQGLP